MSKLTPKDYVEAKDDLAKAGFMAIRHLLDAKEKPATVAEVSTLYGIPEGVVEIVKTTSDYRQYDTISRLETERAELAVELDEVKKAEPKLKPKRWHFVIASIILIVLFALVVWGLWTLGAWVVGLF